MNLTGVVASDALSALQADSSIPAQKKMSMAYRKCSRLLFFSKKIKTIIWLLLENMWQDCIKWEDYVFFIKGPQNLDLAYFS